MSDVDEEFSKSKPPETRADGIEIQSGTELTEASARKVVPASEPPVIPENNFETPHDHAAPDRPANEPPADVKTKATVTADDDSIFLTGWNNLPEGERQYYLDGYNDCFSYRHTPFGYDPPAGHEKAYKEGWEARRLEEDQQIMREWTGLP